MKRLLCFAFLVPTLGCGNSPDKLAAEIQQLGGSCAVDEHQPGKPVVGVSLGMASVGDSFLERLKIWPQLRTIQLWGTGVSDAGMEHLRAFPNLQKLDLSGTTITDSGIQHLKSLTALQEVNLRGTKVSAAAVKDLQKTLPKAKILK